VPSAAPVRPASDPLPADVASILERHRQLIVLVEQGETLDADLQRRADLAGRLLFQDLHHQQAQLTEGLLADLATPAAAGVTAFLERLERHPELRDADKLAFRDSVADLLDAARAPRSTAPSALRTRLEEDDRALREIEALYARELERVFGRFRTRGMVVRREAWDAYVAFLATRYRAEDIIRTQGDRLDLVLRSGGKGQSGAETGLELSGSRLPANHFVLTFDDGPHAKYTEAIRGMLAARGIPAVFFHVGQNVGAVDARGTVTPTRAAAASRQLLRGSGFVLANHSLSHQLLPSLPDVEIGRQIEATNRIVRDVTGVMPTLFRPPYGARNQSVLAAVQARRMTSVLWNIDSKDWADPVPLSIANRVVQGVDSERRGIILFHDIQRRTVEALPRILDELQQRGARFMGWDGTRFVPAGAPPAGTPAPASAGLYRESWAVVVGIDQYRHWPTLSYAVNDARAIREVLIRRYRFKPEHVTLLLDGEATRDRILAAIGDRLADPARVHKDDRVFVFFAGHGATRRLPSGRAIGYLVPVEADAENYQSQAISMTNFQDVSDAVPARHLFLVTDACYSGLALTRGGPAQYSKELTSRVARQVLTAGGADETVADNGPNGHSIFTWTLLQGLEGRADLNGDTVITASELAAYVAPLVSSVSRQTPAFGNLPGSEGGEFLFELQPETEFLSTLSTQLDDEAIRLNGELEKLRAAVAEKQSRNERLRREIAAARTAAGEAASTAERTFAAHNDRGMALFRERRYAEALDAFLAAAAADPKSALAANNAGFAYFRLGRQAEAVTWFEKTLALDPARAVAWANLGDAQLALGRSAEARTAYERYLALQPNSRLAASIRQKLATLPQG
jgi:peptidoglycan/xylan/chitin deacetylase (PgdA/CDA1 family)/uncharacterized caspase-like protein